MSPDVSQSTVALAVGGIISLLCLLGVGCFLRRKRLIDDIPTSKTMGVFIGLAELKGTATSTTPLTGWLTGTDCVWYQWSIEEQWSKLVTETYTDSKGNSRTRTTRKTGWTRLDGGQTTSAFLLEDDTGSIQVLPDGASIEAVTSLDKHCGPTDPLYFGKGPVEEIAHSTHERHFVEKTIPTGSAIYVIGQSRERADVVAPEIAYDKEAPLFLISTRTEAQVRASAGRWYWFFTILGLITALGGVFAADHYAGTNVPPSIRAYCIAAGCYVVAWLLLWLILVFNSLVNLRQRVRQAWSQVDIQLKRRNDLIPNLVQVVSASSGHERQVQEIVTAMRAQMQATPPGVAGPDFDGLAPAMRATVERYPELKAIGSFLELQRSLSETEQRIALARDYFNDIATFYNTRLEIIPDRLVARLGRLRPQPLLAAAAFERAPSNVAL